MIINPSLSGNLLVASSLVTDPIYAGGVCLIIYQDEDQTIGVMLNRPLQPTPEALLKVFGAEPGPSSRLNPRGTATQNEAEFDSPGSDSPGSETESDEDTPIYSESGLSVVPSGEGKEVAAASPWRMIHFGGPHSGPVVAIHQESELAEAETGAGIYVAAQKQHLENLVRSDQVPYRLIVGHLGWRSENLAAEIDAGVWHVIPASAEAVFSPAGEMWPGLIRRATSNSLAKWIGVPDNDRAGELN
jgi:putative transcriptional regulator